MKRRYALIAAILVLAVAALWFASTRGPARGVPDGDPTVTVVDAPTVMDPLSTLAPLPSRKNTPDPAWTAMPWVPPADDPTAPGPAPTPTL